MERLTLDKIDAVRLMGELHKQGDAFKRTAADATERDDPPTFHLYATASLIMFGMAVVLGNSMLAEDEQTFAVPPANDDPSPDDAP